MQRTSIYLALAGLVLFSTTSETTAQQYPYGQTYSYSHCVPVYEHPVTPTYFGYSCGAVPAYYQLPPCCQPTVVELYVPIQAVTPAIAVPAPNQIPSQGWQPKPNSGPITPPSGPVPPSKVVPNEPNQPAAPPIANILPVPEKPKKALPDNSVTAPPVLAKPLPYGGQTTCPVTGGELGSHGSPIPITVQGQTIYVCCQGCVKTVQDNPATYWQKVQKEINGQ